MKRLFITTAIVMLTTTIKSATSRASVSKFFKKKLILYYSLMLLNLITFAQAPNAMNYQAIARDAAGVIHANQNISLRITITDGSGGTTLYQETHNTSTNQFGLFTLSVGLGTPVTGSFAAINWGTVNAWMAVEYDPTGGTNYTLMGQSQLLSVPYALYAADGNPGPQGPQGVQGIPGADGATWFTGAGAPAGSLGVLNDLYLDTNNGDYYKKTGATTWTLQGNLTGPQGPQGIQGPPGGSTNLNGITNYVVKFTPNGTTGGNSQIFDNGNNVGINTTSPLSKLHIKGNADISQLIIDANSIQSNIQPLFKIRNSIGNDLLWLSSDNPNNTFLGLNAGRVNDASGGGIYNTFIGKDAGYSNTTGYANTSIGYQTLYSNTSNGIGNTALGYVALQSNIGSDNTAIGSNSLQLNTNGSDNTAVGGGSLISNILGNYNVAIGVNSLFSNTTGNFNIAVGSLSQTNNVSGNYNSSLGNNAGTISSNFNNTTALGYSTGTTSSDQVRVGNPSIISIGGYVNWTNISDKKFKKNISENIIGKEFIKRLHPVSYTLDASAINKFLFPDRVIRDNELESLNAKEKIIYSGFIAQEVEQAAREVGYDFSGVDAPKNDNDFYGLRYAEFVVPMVKAMQEMMDDNDKLKTELEEMKKIMNELIRRIEVLESNH